MAKKCNCCGKEKPELDMFKYTYGNRVYSLCSICYANVEEFLTTKNNKITLKLTPFEIKKIQLKNEQIDNKIKNLDFSCLPRNFLESFIELIREKEFTNFKRYLKNYENHYNKKIIFPYPQPQEEKT